MGALFWRSQKLKPNFSVQFSYCVISTDRKLDGGYKYINIFIKVSTE